YPFARRALTSEPGPAFGRSVFEVRCSKFGVRSSKFDVRCSMFEVRCSKAWQLNTERRTPSAELRAPNTERRTPNAEHRAPNTERRTPNTERSLDLRPATVTLSAPKVPVPLDGLRGTAPAQHGRQSRTPVAKPRARKSKWVATPGQS